MDSFGLTFHHFGLAVGRPEKATAFLGGMGYRVSDPIFDPEQNVMLALGEHDAMPAVELIWPASGPGPLDAILSGASEIVYHLCYTSRNVDASVDAMRRSGRVLVVSPPKPAILFGGRRVSFYKVAGFGIVELLEAEPA